MTAWKCCPDCGAQHSLVGVYCRVCEFLNVAEAYAQILMGLEKKGNRHAR